MRKTVIVTGGSRGIGRRAALEIAALGFDIAIFYESNTQKAREAAEEIEKTAHVECRIYQVSVTDTAGIRGCFEEIDRRSQIYGLINNAGIVRDGFLMTMKEEDWLKVIDTNLFGTFNCTKWAVSHMEKYGEGRIVNLASVSGLKGAAAQTNYAAAKSAIAGFSRSLAMELIYKNILVFTVAPGFIETEMVNALSPRIREEQIKRIPGRRFGNTGDVAGIIRLLFSEVTDYMPGQIFLPDGGLSCI